MSTSARPFAVQAAEGMVLKTPTGDTAVVKAGTKQTNGALSVIELVIGPKQGPALHQHSREDELWVVLDGEFRFKAGGELFPASTGGMAFGPRGIPHCFQNVGYEAGRLLIVTTPAGVEGFSRTSLRRRIRRCWPRLVSPTASISSGHLWACPTRFEARFSLTIIPL